jgi:hypothetical protein
VRVKVAPPGGPVEGPVAVGPRARVDPVPSRNGDDVDAGNEESPDLLAEAESLRTLLQEGVVRANKLILALRQHKKQSRAVQSAMASLRRLQQLDR